MTINAYGNDHPTVVSIEGGAAALLRSRLAASLPAGSRLDVIRHPEIDARTAVALKLSLPARPNRTLPGTRHPASAPFTIEVSRHLLLRCTDAAASNVRDGSRLAAWIQAHVTGATPTIKGRNPDDAPLIWRFTASSSNDLDICTERVRRASAA